MRNTVKTILVLILSAALLSTAGCAKNSRVENRDAGLTFSQEGKGKEVEIVGGAKLEVRSEEKAGEEETKMEKELKEETTGESAIGELKLPAGLYAVIETSMGRIVCELFEDKAPIGVENFAGLAEGTKEFTDPKTGQKTKRRYYDGLIFHRVIDGFMIQGGDPLGTGGGDPGYRFKNEIHPDLKFDRPGRLAYANAGPDTNGSQFFITHKATPWLDGGYTIFGQTVAGQDVVDAMGKVRKGGPRGETPVEPVIMKEVKIVRIR